MAQAPFKLSCTLFGHSADVRGLACYHDKSIVSVSRDRTTKIWKPNGLNTGYSETQTLTGHRSFVNCVTCMLPNSNHRNGLIITGSNDSTILVYDPTEINPIFTFKGHSNAVVALKIVGLNSYVLSGSWDHSAKLWALDGSTEQAVKTFSGHLSSVLAVLEMPFLGLYLTGSSDKTIKVWRQDGSRIHTVTGHEDVVRALANVRENQFFSSSNDCTVRLWEISGSFPTCLALFPAHNNFIYGLSVLWDGDGFVVVGEGGAVNICKHGDIVQSIALPAESVWTVLALPNGDIVTGSSDGVIRIFSSNPERYGDPELIIKFDEEVKAFTQKPKHVEGLDVNKLPGSEVLTKPGLHEGATIVVAEDGKPICYMWKEGKWDKIGEVTGTDAQTQGRMFEGKEYDYVFKVDIEEGKPPLTLPYNISEDPWFAAQKFIHKHNLPQGYLDQVANFIIKNSKRPNLTMPEPTNSGYVDPFTGGNRYIPQNESSSSWNSGPQADPFTGGSRYLPSGSQETKQTPSHESSSSSKSTNENFFPQRTYLRFDQANLKAITDKLIEFNQRIENAHQRVTEDQIKKVVQLSELGSPADLESITILKELIKWPKDLVFPVLDVTRLAIRNIEINQHLCGKSYGTELMNTLRSYLTSEAPVSSQLLALRVVSNMLSHQEGEMLVLNNCEVLLRSLATLSQPFSKNIEIAVATLILNLAVALEKHNNNSSRQIALQTCDNIVLKFTDIESQFRGLVAVGTLLTSKHHQAQISQFPSQELLAWFTSLTAIETFKVAHCAMQLLAFVD